MPIWYSFKICCTKNNAWFETVTKFISDLLNPLGQMESRDKIITKLEISRNFLEYEQARENKREKALKM